MIGLVHHLAHVAQQPDVALARFNGAVADWMPGLVLGDRRWHLPLRPDGLLEDPHETVDVMLDVGPSVVDDVGALRRLSWQVPGWSPEVRCDLELHPARGHGCRLHLRGSYRVPLATGAAREVGEVVESVVPPLVLAIAARLEAVRLRT